MSDKYRTEYERRVYNRIISFLREMIKASDHMIKSASTENGEGINDMGMYERAVILVEMQSDIIDYLIDFSGESDETILMQLEVSAGSDREERF